MSEQPDVSAEVELVFSMIASQSCQSTVAGWVWYCDAHCTHGNADTEEEAEFMANAHEDYFGEGSDAEDSPCDMYVVKK